MADEQEQDEAFSLASAAPVPLLFLRFLYLLHPKPTLSASLMQRAHSSNSRSATGVFGLTRTNSAGICHLWSRARRRRSSLKARAITRRLAPVAFPNCRG